MTTFEVFKHFLFMIAIAGGIGLTLRYLVKPFKF